MPVFFPIEERINFKIYLKCVHIVKNIFYGDLLELKEKYDGQFIIGEIPDPIYISGLVDVDLASQFNSQLYLYPKEENEKKQFKKLSELGKVIIHIGMNETK